MVCSGQSMLDMWLCTISRRARLGRTWRRRLWHNNVIVHRFAQSAPGSDMAKAIEAFAARMEKVRKRLRRTRELENRRLRRLERRTGTKPSAKEVWHPGQSGQPPLAPLCLLLRT